MQSEDHQWMDPLLLELANDLGADAQTSDVNGALHHPPASSARPPEVKSNGAQSMAPTACYQALNVAATTLAMAGLSQPGLPQLGAGMQLGLASAASLPLTFGSPQDQFGLLGANNMNHMAGFGSLGSNGMLQSPAMLYEQRSCTAAAAAAALAAVARPAGSHSPSSSSGNLGEDYLDHTEQYKCKKPLNKGALAQKRFRERQKEKMRANEAQVADLTSQLHQLQLEKERLESRARLLEQVVSLNLTHEAKLHTNKEIMVREQEMLLEELAQFVVMMGQPAAAAVTAAAAAEASGLQGLFQQQQQQHCMGQQQQQQQVLQQQSGGGSSVTEVAQSLRMCTVACMTDTIFPHYINRLQQLLHSASAGSGSSSNLVGSTATAAAAAQEVSRLVLRREMTDRHALFSHYYWAVWCLNKSEMEFNRPPVPPAGTWCSIFQQLQFTPDQARAMVAARRALLAELRHVADEWQKVLPTLALQLLQVPRDQWHTVGAVQSMVCNLAAEREAVVAFLHTIVDEVLTPQQEGQLEASSYPWCPDVWAITAEAAEAAAGNTCNSGDSAPGSSARGGRGRKDLTPQQFARSDGGGAEGLSTDDPLAALAMGTDVLQPLMPFMTAFQLLRAPITARGAGLRLKRALLLDPFKTVVPAAAFSQPSSAEVLTMSLLDAHCGTFQQMMLWDWLKANLPGYLTLPGLNPSDVVLAVGAGAQAGTDGGAGGLGALVGSLGKSGWVLGARGSVLESVEASCTAA